MKPLRIALAVPALLFSACAFAQTVGNGVSREDSRQVEDFDGVSVSQGLKAQVKVGPKEVRVSGDENLVALVRTEVVDGKLVVRLEKNSRIRSTSGLRITLSSPKITSVEASGGAEVEAEASSSQAFAAEASGGSEISVRNVDAKQLAVEASGGAEVKLQGRAESLTVEASGGSQVHGQDLSNLQAMTVDASGGSQVEANPSDRVVAELSGGSTVHVNSAPSQRVVSSSGGSRVLFRK
ncbi:head GIN domain-containing protein [Hyalangium rubrum]|uniref:Head GIN domain-containing protein n=1 Tax=Hyalangium rubrum TaxID=3103134 RepID=A0ABU5HI87_9BACT|nr:head GIN domain-containing protein [Hyalangium sp. s54d21]MDY7233165.1 head GIN domain-containing protein [Hyalangium sp. s54d21]